MARTRRRGAVQGAEVGVCKEWGDGRCVSLRVPNPIHCHHHAHTMLTVGVYGFYNDAARRVATVFEKRENRF